MEKNKQTLQHAIKNLQEYSPEESAWQIIDMQLQEAPLSASISRLPTYEVSLQVWENIENKINDRPISTMKWWYAAAAILSIAAGLFWIDHSSKPSILYAQEVMDSRLQIDKENDTNLEFQKLKTYCESQTLLCESKNFKQLEAEFQTLNKASEQLREAMGEYNSESELVKQFALLEQEKSKILNQMSKMI